MRERYRNEQEARAMTTYIKLVRATESVTSRVTAILTEAGLTTSQFDVLEAIHHLGPLCQCDIAKKIRKSTGNITQVVDYLEKRGLVRRERMEEDRRYFRIHLTGAGGGLIGELFPKYAAAVTAEMTILGETEQKELAHLCRTLGLQERGEKGRE